MESVDHGPADALRIAGGSRLHVVRAILPAVVPQAIGPLRYRFDVHVCSSLVLGIVGDGGVGLLINQSIQPVRFEQILTYILLVFVVAVDLLSVSIRKRRLACSDAETSRRRRRRGGSTNNGLTEHRR